MQCAATKTLRPQSDLYNDVCKCNYDWRVFGRSADETCSRTVI